MRIAICGIPGSKKTDFVQGFREKWPEYQVINDPEVQKLLAQPPIDQYVLLNAMADEAMKHTKGDQIIYDGCVLDPLCHFLIESAKRVAIPDDDPVLSAQIQKMVMIVKQSLHFYDVIFYVPAHSKFSGVDLSPSDKVLEQHRQYNLVELNNFYKAIYAAYIERSAWLFPFDDPGGSPAMIEIFGTLEERLQMVSMYIGDDGLVSTTSLLEDVSEFL